MTMYRTLAAIALTAIALQADARSAEEWPDIRREINVTEDVLAATLREELANDNHVSSVEGIYLPRQGVLFNVQLSAPWFSIDTEENGTDVHINADLNLEEIPRMVHDILAELQIAVAPYAPEELAELKALREEQRELRREQRDLRSNLRKLRREQVRERDESAREDIREQIAELEVELEAAEAGSEALAQDIEEQYEKLKEAPRASERQRSDAPDVNLAVTRAVCTAAPTLQSVQNEQYVTVALRQSGSMTYITYRMEHVKSCQRRDIDAEKLLDRAWMYTDT